ncbi:MAG: family 43 glycosylhydrolase [Polyangiaceae bacterium]|nr:family 43 glycosylhydrolase [Polyangiaceae bacterium]
MQTLDAKRILAWTVAGLLVACSEGSTQNDTAGGTAGADAGTAADGSMAGGAAAGGRDATGGSANPTGSGGGITGGAGDERSTNGGSSPSESGGSAGNSTGGTSGGASSGGSSGGAAPNGGQPTGGTSVGGSSVGGSSVGGSSSGRGGRSGGTGGQATGGGASGGSASGGSAAGGTTTGPDRIVTFHNGGFWQDTDGNRIEAHGGGFILVGDTWYWIGEDKSHDSGNFKGVNCYASEDLVTWEFKNAIITRNTATELNASDRIIERPKVVYNKKNDNYVMWLHWEGASYATAEAGVFTSDTVDGHYELVRHFRPNSNMSRDDTLFKDDDDKAYFLSAANENADLALYELDADYTNISRQITTLWAGSYREAPAIVKSNGRYFIVSSGATGWDPNQQKYATATSMNGPWSSLSNLGDATGFDTQTTYVLPVQGSRATMYIYMGDRWQDPDLLGSKYIWLPLKVSDTKLALDFYDSWQLNLTTGEWSAGDDRFVSQAAWSLVYVDSEETAGEDGSGVNAFDESISTFWHTQWQDAKPPPPHEIQIDLGARYSLTGMQYTPRQDAETYGMIGEYELYVSESTTDWGSPVKSGTFGTSKTPTLVDFPAQSGRYIRLVALSEINDAAYTSVAELDVVGTAL